MRAMLVLVALLSGCAGVNCACEAGPIARGIWPLDAGQEITDGEVEITADTVIVTWTDDAGQVWEAEYAVVAE